MVCLLLTVLQLLQPKIVLAAQIESEPNLISFKTIQHAYLRGSSSEKSQVADCHDARLDSKGVYRLRFDSSLYQNGLMLYLIDKNSIIGALNYTDQSLKFIGFENYNFQIEDTFKSSTSANYSTDVLDEVLTDPNKDLHLPNFHAYVPGGLILKDVQFAENVWIQTKRLSLEGKLSVQKEAVIRGDNCALKGQAYASSISLKANKFSHEGQLYSHNTHIDIEKGETTQKSIIASTNDIAIGGFESFDHKGQLRAKRAVVSNGSKFYSQPGSFIFAGLMHYAQVKQYSSEGRLTAWLNRIESDMVSFHENHHFQGHYLLASITKQFESHHKSQIDVGVAAQIYSRNRLIHAGSIYIRPYLQSAFPNWEYILGPGKGSVGEIPQQAQQATFASKLQDLKREIDTFRQQIITQLKPVLGIALKAEGTLKNSGTLYSTISSVQQQGYNFIFTGRSQSGFSDNEKTLIKATNAICEGMTKGSHIFFDIEAGLKLAGFLEVKEASIKATNLHANGRVDGSLNVLTSKDTIFSGNICGPFLQVLSKLYELSEGGKVNIQALAAIKSEKAILKGQAHADSLTLESPTIEVKETANIKINEIANIKAQTSFNNSGHVASNGDIYLQLGSNYKLGNLQAKEWLRLKANYFPDIVSILSGAYPEYTRSGGLHLITSQSVTLKRPIETPWGIGLTASSIKVKRRLISQKDISLETQKDTLDIQAPLMGYSLALTSASHLLHEDLSILSNGYFEAKGHYKNNGKVLGPNGTIQVIAASISNSNPTSSIAANILNLEAVGTDIINYGTLQGFTHLGARALRDIYLRATLYNGSLPCFHKAQLIGGTGLEYQDANGLSRKLGLKVEAGRVIDNYASNLYAPSDIFLSAQKGISHRADSVPYIVEQRTKKKGFLKNKKESFTHTSNLIGQPHIKSTGGRIVTHVPKGALDYIGCIVEGAEGDFAIVEGQIRYWHLNVTDLYEVHKSKLWGLCKSSAKFSHQLPVITRVINGAEIDHTSLLKGIHGRGVYLQAPLYRGKAKEEIIFDGIKLDHFIHKIVKNWGFTFFGLDILRAQNSLSKTLCMTDPLINHIQEFKHAQGSPAKFAAGTQLGVQLWKDIKTFSEALQNDSLGTSLLERYGNMGISISKVENKTHYTTTQPSMIHVAILDLEPKAGIKFLDGAQVLIRDLLKVRAPSLQLSKATDTYQTTVRSSSGGVGFNLATSIPYANVSQQHSSSKQVFHTYAHLEVYGTDGKIDLGNLPVLFLDGGHLISSYAEGHIQDLLMTSYQDTFISSQKSGGFSLRNTFRQGMNGGFNLSVGRSSERGVKEHSSLLIRYPDKEKFTIDHLKIIDTQQSDLVATLSKKVSFYKIQDTKHCNNFSVSLAGLSLRSPEAFVSSLRNSLLISILGLGAAEVVHHLGGGPLLSSIVGTISTAGTSWYLNDMSSLNKAPQDSELACSPFTEAPLPSASGLNTLGQISYLQGKRTASIVLLDFDARKLQDDIRQIKSFFDTPHYLQASAQDFTIEETLLGTYEDTDEVLNQSSLSVEEKQLLTNVEPEEIISAEQEPGFDTSEALLKGNEGWIADFVKSHPLMQAYESYLLSEEAPSLSALHYRLGALREEVTKSEQKFESLLETMLAPITNKIKLEYRQLCKLNPYAQTICKKISILREYYQQYLEIRDLMEEMYSMMQKGLAMDTSLLPLKKEAFRVALSLDLIEVHSPLLERLETFMGITREDTYTIGSIHTTSLKIGKVGKQISKVLSKQSAKLRSLLPKNHLYEKDLVALYHTNHLMNNPWQLGSLQNSPAQSFTKGKHDILTLPNDEAGKQISKVLSKKSAKLRSLLPKNHPYKRDLTVLYHTKRFQYDMMNDPGPLSLLPKNPAQNFAGGKYNILILPKEEIVYRAGHSSMNSPGQYFTAIPPNSSPQMRIDYSIKPYWLDKVTGKYSSSPINGYYTFKVPKGMTLHVGPVANQGGIYMGGATIYQIQIFIPESTEKLHLIGFTPFKK